MKWIFYAMVLANAGAFLWFSNRPEPPPPAETAGEPLPGHVNRLLLLSEYEGALRERRPEPPPAAVAGTEEAAEPLAADGEAREEGPPGAAPEPAALCMRVGPLATAEAIERVGLWLDSRGAAKRLHEAERREVSLYWVYLPPFESREAAVAQVGEMRAAAVEDIYVIPRGDMANAVSLGLYSRRESLERRLGELRGKGYEPEVAPRYKVEQASWYEAEFPAGFEFPGEVFADIFPDLEPEPMECAATVARRPSG